jgi:hypothetical protein
VRNEDLRLALDLMFTFNIAEAEVTKAVMIVPVRVHEM